MTIKKAFAAFVALHSPESVKESMVYEVWEDGEITLTKGGPLYGQRTLHRIQMGHPSKALPADRLPEYNGRHGHIVCKDNVDAEAARALVFGMEDSK